MSDLREVNMKFISKVISLVLFIGILNQYTFAATKTFTDVKDTDWFYKDVTRLVDQGVVNGFDDSTFKPAQQLQRDQWIKLLVSTKNKQVLNSQGYWATNYIQEAFNLGILNSTYPTLINGKNYATAINRYETTKLMMTLIPSTAIPSNWSEFSTEIADYAKIPTQYKDSIVKAYAIGLITGYPDGTIQGNNILNRAESTSLINRIIDPAQRYKPLSPSEQALEDNLVTDDTELYSNLTDTINFKEEDIVYDSVIDTYTLDNSNLSPAYKSLAEHLFTLWNNEIIYHFKAGFLHSSINKNVFNMDYSVLGASQRDVRLTISDNDMVSLYLTDTIDIQSPNVQKLLGIFTVNYDEADSAQLNSLIVSEFNNCKQNATYNSSISVGTKTVLTSKNENFVIISFK